MTHRTRDAVNRALASLREAEDAAQAEIDAVNASHRPNSVTNNQRKADAVDVHWWIGGAILEVNKIVERFGLDSDSSCNPPAE